MEILVKFLFIALAISKMTEARFIRYSEYAGIIENPEEGDHFEGDMVLTSEQQEKINLTHDGNRLLDWYRYDSNPRKPFAHRWPIKNGKGVVPYYIDPTWGFTPNNIKLIRNAMDGIEQVTCVRFVPKTNENDFVNIISHEGCYSYVGRIGGSQNISLNKYGCLSAKGRIQHELIHALGSVHTQSRFDRDNFVRIVEENIQSGRKNQFTKANPEIFENHGNPYDYYSVMHYPRNAFAKAGLYSIEVLDPEFTHVIGQRDGISEGDIASIRKVYDCVPREEVEEGFYFEGDIDLSPDQMNVIYFPNDGHKMSDFRWPKNNGEVVVPYSFDISAYYTKYEKSLIRNAMDGIQRLTCIRFVPKINEKDYVNIFWGPGCYSALGKTGGEQDISIAKPGCMRGGLIQHQLMHTLGLIHTQSRNDRDQFVRISKDAAKIEFRTEHFNKVDLQIFDYSGLPYDYSSVMHYPRNAFSKIGLYTIVPTNGEYINVIGQREWISKGDLDMINKMYNCEKFYTNPETTTVKPDM